MTKKIFKYQLEVSDEQVIKLPKGSEILCIQVQHDTPCMWAMVDTEAPMEDVVIETIGTGNPVEILNRMYIGTYQINGGRLVFHCFRVIE